MRKNVYVAALKYELCHCDGVDKICQIIGKSDAFLPESEAWCWFEKHETDIPAIKKTVKKIRILNNFRQSLEWYIII